MEKKIKKEENKFSLKPLADRVLIKEIEKAKNETRSGIIIPDGVDVVSPDIFFSERHRLIWETIQELFSKSEPIDLLSLSSRLEEKSQLDRAGGTSYLAELDRKASFGKLQFF
jgi:hypothetical protein